MTVKVYVSRDSSGRPWPPDYGHEALATMEIIKRLWSAFHHEEAVYVAVANLHHPSADLVLISERGLGVIELKHYYGLISRRPDNAWYAGPKRIQAGSEGRGYDNPHQQVQAYAESIREELIHPGQPNSWLPGTAAEWDDFKLHTAVCFSHPDVFVEDFRTAMGRRWRPDVKGWERFSILTPEEVPGWAAALRFEVNRGWEHNFEPFRLTPQQTIRIGTDLLDGTEWTELVNLMPTGEPYAYLTRVEDGRRVQVFGLDREEVLMGRNPDACAVPVPERFTYVGRIHACIVYTVQGIFVKDMDSKNGTFIDGRPIPKGKRTRLGHGQAITLGGPSPSDKVCGFELSIRVKLDPTSTEKRISSI